MNQKKQVILASASPRRHEILTLAGIDHCVITSNADESCVKFQPGKPEEYAIATASVKNDGVYEILKADGNLSGLILSADTIVYTDGAPAPLGKPKDRDDAILTLESLSGITHKVVTGVVLRDAETGRRMEFAVSTSVNFRPLSHHEIASYVDSGEPMDKAGSYGIQGGACSFVRSIEGDYFNVVGLPICAVVEAMRELGAL
ncbi:MAG: septum formation protein Maf [Ruminococcaceae bacterium]|nr:septum formation protein Maf [Oscillospiraceae bacterium]